MSGTCCTSLLVDNEVINNPKVLANEFNQFFISSAPQIVTEIHPSTKSPTNHLTQNENFFSLSNVPVTPTEVIEATRKLLDKKTPDEFGLTSYLI